MKRLFILMMIISTIWSMSSCTGKEESDDEKSLIPVSDESVQVSENDESSQHDESVQTSEVDESLQQSENDESSHQSDEGSILNKSEYFIKVPEEYKDLAVGKALNSIDTSNGYIFVFQFEDSEYIKYVEKGDNIRIVGSVENSDNVLVTDENIFLLDEDTKTYSIADEYYWERYSFFDPMEYLETTEKEVGGVKYTVDKFSIKAFDDISTDENIGLPSEVLEFYTTENALKYISYEGEKVAVSFSFDDVDSYLKIPNDYKEMSLKNIVEEYFKVPEKYEKHNLGKEFNTLDVEKGFSFTLNVKDESEEDIIGYYIMFKDSKAYIGQYDENGYVKMILYKNAKRYVMEIIEFSFSESQDALGKGLGISGNFFDRYIYVGTRTEDVEVDGSDEKITCEVESFLNKDGKTVEFYFNDDKLTYVVNERFEIWIDIDSSGDIDESLFNFVA